ncbi:MAG: GDP-mannose 4,6-dehydratase, partial [Thermodesulfobacteriota bacterium]|nr:GDP-mannose 4,6-dehydratase [Thermodesulfobacteriota bacterium]
RSFCYIDDMIEGIIKVLQKESDKTFEERINRENFLYKSSNISNNSVHNPINLGNPRELSVLDITQLILQITESQSSIGFAPLPADDPKVRRPDISKAKELLQWEPKVNIEEALERTIQYFKSCMNTLASSIPNLDLINKTKVIRRSRQLRIGNNM